MRLAAADIGAVADRKSLQRLSFPQFLNHPFQSIQFLGPDLLGAGAVSQALGSPSRAALLPQIVDRGVFTNAVAWNSTVFHIASMTGPAAGGLIVGLHADTTTALALVTACRALSLAAIWRVRNAPAQGSDDAISWDSLLAGIRFVWQTKLILATITLDLSPGQVERPVAFSQ